MSRRSRSRSPQPRGSRPRVRSRSRDRYPTPFDDTTALASTELPTDLQNLVFNFVPEQFDPVQCPSLTDNGAQCRFPYEYRWAGQNRSCARYCLQDVQDLFTSLFHRSVRLSNARGDLDFMEVSGSGGSQIQVRVKDCTFRNIFEHIIGDIMYARPADTRWHNRAYGLYDHFRNQPVQLNTLIYDMVEPAIKAYPEGCILQISICMYVNSVPPPGFTVDTRSTGLPSYVQGPKIQLDEFFGRIFGVKVLYDLTIPLGCRAPRTGLRSGDRRR